MDSRSVFTKRMSVLTLMFFIVFSVMPFPGYAEEWNGIDRTVAEDGKVIYTATGNHTIDLDSFDQGVNDNWQFNLDGNLFFNVTGSNATTWAGTSNVFGGLLGLFNRNGVHFTNTANINLHNAGFIGAAMRTVDGMHFKGYALDENNNKVFDGGYLLNEGKISGTGNAALLGRAVENKGTIDLPAHRIHLAGGDAMTVGLSGDNLISVVVDEATSTSVKDFENNTLTDQIKNSGKIVGNKITLDAKGIDAVFEKAINLTGEVKAVDVGENEKGELVLMSMDDIYSKAILEASKMEIHTDGNIETRGSLKADELNESGATFKIGGQFSVKKSHHDNADNAIIFDEDTTITGVEDGTGIDGLIEDNENIVIDGVTITLGSNFTFRADKNANGDGAILMNEGSKIVGGGFNLTLAGSGQSIIREITGVGDLTLNAQSGIAEFTLHRGVDITGDLKLNANTLLNGTYSMTVRGGDVTGEGDINLTGGTFTVRGSGNFGGSQDWTFNQLIFGEGADAAAETTTQKVGTNDITIAQDWLIKEKHTLKAGLNNETWDVTWGDGIMKDVIKIAGGGNHTLALSGLDGSVYAWGVGRLGDGTTSSRYTPVRVRGVNGIGYLTGATDIAAGSSHSLALVNGGVKAWGHNGSGELGNGTTTTSLTPVDVTGLTSGVTAIAAGNQYSLAVVNGGVKAWGYNLYGQLGDGTTTNRSLAVDVTGLTSGVTAIAAGYGHSLALVNGGVKAWGQNYDGQLGDGNSGFGAISTTAVDVTGLPSGVTAISAGYHHSLALVNGGVKAWGINNYGQLGNGNSGAGEKSTTAVDVTGLTSGVTAIEAGGSHSLALVNGGVKAWGYNSNGALGDGTTTNRSLAVDVTGLTGGVTAISAGGGHSLALVNSGVKAWGYNGNGQLGDGTTSSRSAPVGVLPVLNLGIAKLSEVQKVVAGEGHSLALLLNQTVMAWGSNLYGQLGDGTASTRLTPVFVRDSNSDILTGVTDVAAGSRHSVALVNGGVKAWGWNTSGQLGDGTTTNRLLAVNVTGLTSGVTAIAAGGQHSLALVNGGIKAWGSNFLGQLGDGTTTDSSLAVDVTGLTSGVTAIAAGSDHSLALVNGGVKAWGSNVEYQLGDGTTTSSSLAVDVIGLEAESGVTAIAAGGFHSLALVNGGVKAWGANYSGPLGDGTTTHRSIAVDVTGLTSGVTAIAAGREHSFALVSGGLKAWGSNGSGQLGDGTTTNRSLAVDVTGLTSGVTTIATGGAEGYHSLIVVNGGVKAWGSNYSGKLGNNQTSSSTMPIDTGTLVFEPFVNRGIFDAQTSTVKYSGDVVIAGQRLRTQIADVKYNDLVSKFRDVLFRGLELTPDRKDGPTVTGRFTFGDDKRKEIVIDDKNVVHVDPRERMMDMFKAFGLEGMNPHEVFRMMFDGGRGMEMRAQTLQSGVNNFEVTPQDLGMDSGFDDFQKSIFAAEPEPLDERKENEIEKTGTSFANITGPVKVVAQDGTVYDAKEGMSLQKGDQVWTGAGAKVELATEDGKNVVTLKENSAVSVDKNTTDEASAPQDLLKIAFGKVSVAVSSVDSKSNFVVQVPSSISGQRG